MAATPVTTPPHFLYVCHTCGGYYRTSDRPAWADCDGPAWVYTCATCHQKDEVSQCA